MYVYLLYVYHYRIDSVCVYYCKNSCLFSDCHARSKAIDVLFDSYSQLICYFILFVVMSNPSRMRLQIFVPLQVGHHRLSTTAHPLAASKQRNAAEPKLPDDVFGNRECSFISYVLY